MNKTFAKITVVLFALAVILPVLCSCSFSEGRKVGRTAGRFATKVCYPTPDVLDFTYGLSRDYKNSFKDLFNDDNYTYEQELFIDAMISSLEYEFVSSPTTVNKDKAECTINFFVADLEKLKQRDYQEIQELTSAVENCDRKTITIDVELEKINKEWYVTNFDDPKFRELYSFFYDMPTIGRGTLIQTAEKLAKAIIEDDADTVVYLIGPNITTEQSAYIASLFDRDGNPSDEEKAFRDAVLGTMTYKIDEANLSIDGVSGYITIEISMADYETLAGKTFQSIQEMTDAVNACGTKSYSYKCNFIRHTFDWDLLNVDSDEFAAIMNYKRFSISLEEPDGTYNSTTDETAEFVNYVSKEFGVKMPSDLEGKNVIKSALVLDNGNYKVTVDRRDGRSA